MSSNEQLGEIILNFSGVDAQANKYFKSFKVGFLTDSARNEIKLAVTENKIKTEVNDAFRSLTKSLSSLKAKKVEYLQAKNNFELQQQRYDIGDISRVDFENSKTDWESAQLTYMKAQAETKLNERKLYFACGYPEKL
jgi:outer membrane protein TolC